MANTELKPCPYCESIDVFELPADNYWVSCLDCDMDGPSKPNQKAANDAWNAMPRRDDCQQAQKDALTLARVVVQASYYIDKDVYLEGIDLAERRIAEKEKND